MPIAKEAEDEEWVDLEETEADASVPPKSPKSKTKLSKIWV